MSTVNLTVGTRILSKHGECDEGIMSNDDTNTLVERSTGTNAIGTIFRLDHRKETTIYHVEFKPSEVWVCLEAEELSDGSKYAILP